VQLADGLHGNTRKEKPVPDLKSRRVDEFRTHLASLMGDEAFATAVRLEASHGAIVLLNGGHHCYHAQNLTRMAKDSGEGLLSPRMSIRSSSRFRYFDQFDCQPRTRAGENGTEVCFPQSQQVTVVPWIAVVKVRFRISSRYIHPSEDAVLNVMTRPGEHNLGTV